jgi:hypothetical protein
MPVVNMPDAVIGKLLATAAVTSIASTRISGKRQDLWDLKAQAAIVVEGPIGGPGDGVPAIGYATERCDIVCYAPNGRDAKILAQTVLETLIPYPGAQAGFRLQHTRVTDIQAESGRIALTDPNTGWTSCTVPVQVSYRREYIA